MRTRAIRATVASPVGRVLSIAITALTTAAHASETAGDAGSEGLSMLQEIAIEGSTQQRVAAKALRSEILAKLRRDSAQCWSQEGAQPEVSVSLRLNLRNGAAPDIVAAQILGIPAKSAAAPFFLCTLSAVKAMTSFTPTTRNTDVLGDLVVTEKFLLRQKEPK